MSPTELSMFPIQKTFFTFQIVILPIKILPFPFKLVTFKGFLTQQPTSPCGNREFLLAQAVRSCLPGGL